MIAHDCHHLLVTGTCAANALIDAGGGVAVVRDGTVIALVELPNDGLMSDEPAGVVAEKSARVMRALGESGCAFNNGYADHPAGAGRDPRVLHTSTWAWSTSPASPTC